MSSIPIYSRLQNAIAYWITRIIGIQDALHVKQMSITFFNPNLI